jgi:hypothetical protein
MESELYTFFCFWKVNKALIGRFVAIELKKEMPADATYCTEETGISMVPGLQCVRLYALFSAVVLMEIREPIPA